MQGKNSLSKLKSSEVYIFFNIKESSANQIEGQTAYMLFFERDGIDMKAYLPKLREPSTSSAESANSDSTAGKATPAVIGLEDEDGKKCCIM